MKSVKSEMAFYVTVSVFFLGRVLCSSSQFPRRLYHYVQTPLTWAEAQSFCREHYDDLATFESEDDLKTLKAGFSYEWAWLGLSDDPRSWRGNMGNDSNSWRWSATEGTSRTGYQAWRENEPNRFRGVELCVEIRADGTWNDIDCLIEGSFICYSAGEELGRRYEHVSLQKTWSSARSYCRERYTDLAVIESDEENSQVISEKPKEVWAWIGLYRVPWTWSDMSQSSFRNWSESSPDNFQENELCVAENPLHEWNDQPCERELSFICQQDSKKTVATVRVRFETDADLTDPTVDAQLLQQLGAALSGQGGIHLRLRWGVQPRKQQETGPDCQNTEL